MSRLHFQRQCVASTTGIVYNVGSYDDPARLRFTFGERVLNCDMRSEVDHLGNTIAPQLQFDCTEPWPIETNSGGLVVLGDIIEHLTDDEILHAFAEARRVAAKLCVTVPLDDRPWADPALGLLPAEDYERYAKWGDNLAAVPKPRPHINVIDRTKLERLLAASGWQADELHAVDYGFVPLGFYVLASHVKEASRE